MNMFTSRGRDFLRLADIGGYPERPLGELSTFVIGSLPQILRDIRNKQASVADLSDKVEALLTTNSVSGNQRLALLDMKMLESAIVHSGGVPGNKLVSTINDFSDQLGMLPGMTYEDYIINNPPHDMRTFSADPNEKGFIRGHQMIEEFLQPACNALTQVVLARGIGMAGDYVRPAIEQIAKVADMTKTVGSVDAKKFNADFRPYLGSSSFRNQNGPSGAATAKIPIIDLLFAGSQFPKHRIQELLSGLGDYPTCDRDALLNAIEQAKLGRGLVDLYLTRNSNIDRGELDAIKQSLLAFRGAHYKAVDNVVPVVLRGDGKGTGGQSDVKSFLQNRIKELTAITY